MGEDDSGFGVAIREDYVIVRDAVDIATVNQNDRSVFGRKFKDWITVLGNGILVRFGMDLDANTFWSLQDIFRLIIRFSL